MDFYLFTPSLLPRFLPTSITFSWGTIFPPTYPWLTRSTPFPPRDSTETDHCLGFPVEASPKRIGNIGIDIVGIYRKEGERKAMRVDGNKREKKTLLTWLLLTRSKFFRTLRTRSSISGRVAGAVANRRMVDGVVQHRLIGDERERVSA